MKDAGIAWLATLAYSGAMVAVGTTDLTDKQALIIALSAGMAGGVLASVAGKDPISWRSGMSKLIVCCLAVPALVVLGLNSFHEDQGMKLFPVTAYCGAAAIFAWPFYEKLGKLWSGLSIADLKSLILRMMGK